MAALELAISKIFIDVATHTAVDVISGRSVSPLVRGAGRVFHFYSLIEPACGIYNAIRISAYADAFGVAAYHAVVHLTSEHLAHMMVQIDGANFAISKQAAGYLLAPEFAEGLSADDGPLSGWIYHSDFPSRDYSGGGQPLFDQTIISTERAMRALAIANELLAYPESSKPRHDRSWKEPERENWVDVVNTQLGYVFWRPVPEIGLGLMRVTSATTYRGIIRRNTAEGYGRIEWSNGNVYFGQVKDGEPLGYGVYFCAAGNLFIGHTPKHALRLGVSVSADHSTAYYGQHKWANPDGYGRQIGLANGATSMTGLWLDGQVMYPLETQADTFASIADGMKGRFVNSLAIEYNQKASMASRTLELMDSMIVTQIQSIL